ncbi:acyl carrier protein [mine drainage metagenome]|uniref:Acyl carrier protein n=1 Tax=mine drainage metagenome TaxID=410659 RepID=A0A1J5QM61_9ZZZZ
MSVPSTSTLPADAAFLRELAGLIVESLNLDVPPADIDPDAPLYGDGLGLDSIDILELALVVSKSFGVQLRADDANNHKIFSSLRNLADYVAAHRAH